MKRYPIDHRYEKAFREAGLDTRRLALGAGLSESVFSEPNSMLTGQEFLRLMACAGEMLSETNKEQIATHDGVETFSPTILAAYCSPNIRAAMERLQRFKRLVAPIRIETRDEDGHYVIEYVSDVDGMALPEFLVQAEFRFLLHIFRMATKQEIAPMGMVIGERNLLMLCQEDVERPFVSANEDIWHFFEPELKKRLDEIDTDDSVAAQVRSTLVQLLPGHKCKIEDVASELCMSSRSLQRRLTDEGTTFQKQLNHVRELLARNYLREKQISLYEIADLLGYGDVQTFARAYQNWTGRSVYNR